ncbi:MAG: prepilin-type N-terminal cleavage/methylation domain-containing protein [Arenicella sp.]|jgi:prepilin-type N-terminal cleavage/methylation domain-containing protein
MSPCSHSGFTLIEVMVALSILALGISGVAELRHTAYQHINLTQEIQQASYFADTHLNALGSDKPIAEGIETGEYTRGEAIKGYPWQLTLVPLSEQALQPESDSLSGNVRPFKADLSVWVDQGTRELRFHTLLLAKPFGEPGESQGSRPTFKLRAKN